MFIVGHIQYVYGAARCSMLFLERGYDGLDLLWRRFASWTYLYVANGLRAPRRETHWE